MGEESPEIERCQVSKNQEELHRGREYDHTHTYMHTHTHVYALTCTHTRIWHPSDTKKTWRESDMQKITRQKCRLIKMGQFKL